MKNKKLVLIIFLFSICSLSSFCFAQDVWTQKADYGGTETYGAVGFSIGSKGYIGTGTQDCLLSKEFWEYDPANDSWTQKADFGGIERFWAVGFSIGSKAYLGTGDYNDTSDVMLSDFWEYDQAADTWTQKADFQGPARYGAVGFSIGSKGYIGTGLDVSVDTNILEYRDFWEYDPATDTWTKKADFPGTARGGAVGFSIGSKGYIGTGVSINSDIAFNDFWEYNPSDDSWTQKTDFAGGERDCAVGFSIDSNGYIGTGLDINSGNSLNDFWEYDTTNNNWTQKADLHGNERSGAVGFSIDSKAYLGTGSGDTSEYKDFYEYSPSGSGIEEFSEENIFISPNPVSSILTIKCGEHIPACSLCKIYDALGTLVIEKTITGNKLQIDVSKFAKGLYFLKVENENTLQAGQGIIVKKFIKQ